jgi:7-cyano-7-deazaguanine synthase
VTKAVVLLSGGMDSSTLLARLVYEDTECHALSMYYYQKHRRELDAAQAVAQHYGVPWEEIDLGDLTGQLFSSSALVNKDLNLPLGHYAAESMKSTVVPNRNMLFLAIAGAYAINNGLDEVAYANHAGDHAIYPDCRPGFAHAMRLAFEELGLTLRAPFTNITKGQIALQGKSLHVPYALTYSCYAGRERHCGLCGTCTERKEAFTFAGIPDPTEYEA